MAINDSIKNNMEIINNMSNFGKIWFVSFAAILIPLAYHCFDIFILGNYDPKMGIEGTLIVYFLFYFILEIINATVFAIIYYFKNKEKPSRKILLYTFLFNALLLILYTLIYYIFASMYM
jgi:hypothetical protein